MPKLGHRWRSSVTGRFVSKLFALLWRRETQREARDTRVAFFVEDTPEEWIEALKNADCSHLPNVEER